MPLLRPDISPIDEASQFTDAFVPDMPLTKTGTLTLGRASSFDPGMLMSVNKQSSASGDSELTFEEVDFLKGHSEINIRALKSVEEALPGPEFNQWTEAGAAGRGRLDSKPESLLAGGNSTSFTESKFDALFDVKYRSVSNSSNQSNARSLSKRSTKEFMGDMLPQKKNKKPSRRSMNVLLAGAEKFKSFRFGLKA